MPVEGMPVMGALPMGWPPVMGALPMGWPPVMGALPMGWPPNREPPVEGAPPIEGGRGAAMFMEGEPANGELPALDGELPARGTPDSISGVEPGSQFLSRLPQSGQVSSAQDMLGGWGNSFWQMGQ
jgi:hypothetical protein